MMAPASAARITYCVTCFGSTRPLAMVLATAVPNTNAAIKLKAAAQAIDFNAVFQHVVMLFTQTGQCVSKLVRLFYDNFRQHSRGFRRGGDLVHHQTDARSIDKVENVVQ